MPEMYSPNPEEFKQAESILTDEQKEMSNKRKEKEENLNTIRVEIDTTGDRLGYPIDEDIKETVVFLKALGISTTGSCEGHPDSGLPGPWVEIAAENEPEERWENQNSIFETIAQKYNMSTEDVKRPGMDAVDAWQEAMITASKNPETADYKKWIEKNKEFHDKVASLVDDFNRGRDINPETKMMIEDFDGSHFRISFLDKDTMLKIIREEFSREEREE